MWYERRNRWLHGSRNFGEKDPDRCPKEDRRTQNLPGSERKYARNRTQDRNGIRRIPVLRGGCPEFPSGKGILPMTPGPKRRTNNATHEESPAGTVRPASKIPHARLGPRGDGNPLPVRRSGRVSAVGADSRNRPGERRKREGMTWTGNRDRKGIREIPVTLGDTTGRSFPKNQDPSVRRLSSGGPGSPSGSRPPFSGEASSPWCSWPCSRQGRSGHLIRRP